MSTKKKAAKAATRKPSPPTRKHTPYAHVLGATLESGEKTSAADAADAADTLEAEAKARAAEKDELKKLREQNQELLKANRRLAAALAHGAAKNIRAASEMQAAIGMGGD